ncbi:hypothetical protein [Thiomicrospira sp. WB1]|uniref:hypothetical protein n=1 Tax=Thiomicrospira sp. WB1 TaxID=1685380 RepID=UPI000745F439|nr:hypothetical protein [Thiomicrospira sp. WB1]KUJ72545.1 hypothetical protein AVO41_01685 [Thiomicrospira sp. WB1]
MSETETDTQKKTPTLLHAKLIGGVIARGESKRVLEALPPGKIMASEYVSIRNAQSTMAGENWEEMDLLRLVVRADDAEDVFAQLHELAEVSTREGVYLYQHDVPRCTEYTLPFLPEEGLALSVLKDPEQAREMGLDDEQVAQLKTLAQNE